MAHNIFVIHIIGRYVAGGFVCDGGKNDAA